jgi:hypothetical protein
MSSCCQASLHCGDLFLVFLSLDFASQVSGRRALTRAGVHRHRHHGVCRRDAGDVGAQRSEIGPISRIARTGMPAGWRSPTCWQTTGQWRKEFPLRLQLVEQLLSDRLFVVGDGPAAVVMISRANPSLHSPLQRRRETDSLELP